MSKKMITYCPVCDDGWTNENFEFGLCCLGVELLQRLETDDEYCQRIAAENRIRNRVKELDW